MSSISFITPEGFDLEHLLGEITAQYTLISDREQKIEISYYDSFDWRLYNKDYALRQSEHALILERLSDGSQIQRISCASQPTFAQDIPKSKLRQEVAAIIEMRALIKQVALRIIWKHYRIFNDDQKTVVQIAVEEILFDEAQNKSIPNQIRLVPVRGYPRYFRELANLLTRKGFLESSYRKIFSQRLSIKGKKARDYTSKLDFKLDPQMSADQAMKVILRFLLGVIRQNERGIKEDVDTEFLHDFRVAIRRTRSALSQIKGVFPAEEIERFQEDFSNLGSLTNSLRDLDVYLLNEDKYKSMLPEFLQIEIEPMFDFLRDKRADALQSVREGLESSEYIGILADWEKYLNREAVDSASAPNAQCAISPLASERIQQRYRRVVKTGRKALREEDDELLHILRIDCKKLRYLLEFFASLYPPETISLLISQLKTLQDYLGEFHDLVVQQEYLLHISDELAASGKVKQGTLLSIGSLIGSLEDEKVRLTSAFGEVFKQFKSQENRALFEELFRIEERA